MTSSTEFKNKYKALHDITFDRKYKVLGNFDPQAVYLPVKVQFCTYSKVADSFLQTEYQGISELHIAIKAEKGRPETYYRTSDNGNFTNGMLHAIRKFILTIDPFITVPFIKIQGNNSNFVALLRTLRISLTDFINGKNDE